MQHRKIPRGREFYDTLGCVCTSSMGRKEGVLFGLDAVDKYVFVCSKSGLATASFFLNCLSSVLSPVPHVRTSQREFLSSQAAILSSRPTTSPLFFFCLAFPPNIAPPDSWLCLSIWEIRMPIRIREMLSPGLVYPTRCHTYVHIEQGTAARSVCAPNPFRKMHLDC